MSDSLVLDEVEQALRDHFGAAPDRASVTFLGTSPVELLRFEPIPGQFAYVSLGMAREPMTAATEAIRSSDGPRAELLLEAHDRAGAREVWRRLAVLAAAPVVEGVVYAPGMTVDLDSALTEQSAARGVVIDISAIGTLTTGAGPVQILQALPATANELAWARVNGASELIGRWRERGTDLLDLARSSVDLSR